MTGQSWPIFRSKFTFGLFLKFKFHLPKFKPIKLNMLNMVGKVKVSSYQNSRETSGDGLV